MKEFMCYDESFCENRDCTECEAFEEANHPYAVEVNHHYAVEVYCPERMEPYVHTYVKHYMIDITSRMLVINCEGISFYYNMDKIWKFAVWEEGDNE